MTGTKTSRSRRLGAPAEGIETTVHEPRAIARQLLPGLALPGLIYYIASAHTSVVVALAAASSVPLLDAASRIARRRAPSPFGLVFVAAAGISVGLAVTLHSPAFILAKGAAISTLVGLAFVISAMLGRPLTRTLAVTLSSDHPEGRRHLSERWHHPKALAVFRLLSFGWGALLLVLAIQQAVLALTVSPGLVMALDPLIHGGVTVAGIAVSVGYVRRAQRANPELGLLPARS